MIRKLLIGTTTSLMLAGMLSVAQADCGLFKGLCHHPPHHAHRCGCPPEVIFVREPAGRDDRDESARVRNMPSPATQVISPYAMMGMPMMGMPMMPAMAVNPVQYSTYRPPTDEAGRVRDDVRDCHERLERVERAVISLDARMSEIEKTLRLQTELLKEKFKQEPSP